MSKLKNCRFVLLSLTLALVSSPISADTTATQRLRKVKDAVVYYAPEFYSSFPSIAALPDGDLLCAFRQAPSRKYLYGNGDGHTHANSYLVSVRSSDNGETWTTAPQLIHAHPFGGSQDPCLLTLQDGNLLCTSYGWAPMTETELKDRPDILSNPGFGFLGGYLVRSSDSGRSWSDHFYPPALPGDRLRNLQGGDLPTYNRGALCQMRDGSITWAVVNHEASNGGRSSVHLLRSKDSGTSWIYQSRVAIDSKLSFNETSLIETKDGDLVAFLRTTDKDMKAAMAISRDGGQSFEPWVDLGWSGLPLQAIQLKQGGILVVYGYRTAPFGVRARLVSDDLSDAKTAPELILRDDGGNADLGYPWAVQLPDGRVLVVYYINVKNGQRHIAATWLEAADS